MKGNGLWLPLLLIAAVVTGCNSGGLAPSVTLVEGTPSPNPTASPTLTQTATWTLLAATPTSRTTLTPAQAEAALQTLLREPIDCAAPCFWGITPGKTTLDEAMKIFAHFGLYGSVGITIDNKPTYGTRYDFDNGLWIAPILLTQGDVIKGSEIELRPEKAKPGVGRDWLAYSPETLIKRYGPPSRVEFSIERGIASSMYRYYMTMYFDDVGMVAEYMSEFDRRPRSFTACPLTDQFHFMNLWMAEAPEDRQNERTPLETATPMTMGEFAALMTGDPSKACLELKK